MAQLEQTNVNYGKKFTAFMTRDEKDDADTRQELANANQDAIRAITQAEH